ncbi:MAG: hypothetical protein PHN64_07050 [Desulfovibrionaceae bacterium]|nr:hypothetical protein [Desulfovibrionaceae bacterium]
MAKLSVLRSIRRFCLECQGNSSKAVQACADAACPLWAWRLPPAPEAEQPQHKAVQPAQQACLLTPCTPPCPKEPAPCMGLQPFSAKSRQALRAIRRQCLLCAGGRADVRQCRAKESCMLWSYRFGVRPEKYKAVRRRFFSPKALPLL